MKQCRLFRIFVVFCSLLTLFAELKAQEDENEFLGRTEIDSVMAFSPDFMPVGTCKLSPLIFQPLKFRQIDTSVVHIHRSDALQRTDVLYSGLGINGQAHQSLRFDFDREVGFNYITLPYPLYFKRQQDLDYYDVQKSYTNIAYTFGISKENMVNAVHAQKVKGVTFVFNLNGRSNEGYYTHQKVGDISADFLIHYEIPSGIYGFRASYIYNRFRIQENGGLKNPADFQNHISTQLAGYNLNLYNANTNINTHDALFQQYVNLKTKKKDDKKQHYLGTITHTFEFKLMKSTFFDNDLDSLYYHETFYHSADTTQESVHYYSVVNTLQWSSYNPFDAQSNQKYFIHFSGGLRHEYVESFPKDKINVVNRYFGNTFTLFGNVNCRLFSVVDLQADLAYSFGDYNKNDAIANLKGEFFISRKREHYIGFGAHFYRIAPDYLYSYYNGNNVRWDTAWAKQNILKLSAYWNYDRYRVSFNYFMLNDFMVLDDTYHPYSIDEVVSVAQLNVFAPFRWKGLGFDLNGCLQYSDNKYVQVPLFAGKLSLFYVFHLFDEKMRLQLGTDLAYNTAYYANGYYPGLHQFFCQQKTKIGNYLFFDLFLNLRIKRVGFFFRAGHVLSGIMGYNYFSAPNFPAQGRNFSIGINWSFYD